MFVPETPVALDEILVQEILFLLSLFNTDVPAAVQCLSYHTRTHTQTTAQTHTQRRCLHQNYAAII